MSFAIIKNLAYLEALILVGYAVFFACLSRSSKRELGYRPATIFGLLTATVFLAPSLWIIHAVFLVTVPMIARGRAEIGLVYVIGLLATPEFDLPLSVAGIDLTSLSNHSSLALGALVALVAQGRRRVRRPLAADFPALAIGLLLLMVYARDTTATNFLRQAITLIASIGVPYYVVTRSLRSADDVRRLLLWLTAAAAILSVIVLFEMLRHWPLYTEAGTMFGMGRGGMFVMRSGLMRAAGPLDNTIAMGFFLVIGLAAALSSRSAFPSKAFHLGVLALIGAGLVAPLARTAWLGAAVALLMISIYRARRLRSAGLLVPAAAAGILAFIAVSFGGGSDAAGTVDYRQQLLQRGIEEFKKSPIFGDSYTNMVRRMGDLVQGEGIVDFVNSYLYFGLLTGTVGVIMFILSLGIVPVRLWRARSGFPHQSVERGLAAFCFGTIIAAMAMFAFTSFAGRSVLLVLFAAGLAATIRKTQRPIRTKPIASPAEAPQRAPMNDLAV